jgi:aspartate/glutamate racemase
MSEAPMKHIGILAHSYEGATLCFHEMCAEGVRRLGPHLHPEITLTCTAMAHSLDAWDREDHAELRAMFVEDAEKLEEAGADFFVCPDNSAHIALESPGEPFPIPALHIAEVVADQARRDGRRKVGILGTNWTMTGPVYPGALAAAILHGQHPAKPTERSSTTLSWMNYASALSATNHAPPMLRSSTGSPPLAAIAWHWSAPKSRC